MSTDSIMDRLRRANPSREIPYPEDAALLEGITALPGDSRLDHRRGRRLRRRRTLAFVFALAIAVLLASTAVAVSRWIDSEFVRLPVTRQEYYDAQKQLRLPPGVTWPAFVMPPDADISVTSRGAGGGQAVLIAQNAWECYWVRAIRNGDTAAAQLAHSELNNLLAHHILEAPAGASENWTPTPPPAVPVATFAHDGGLDHVRAWYRQAAAGKPRNLVQSCKANAP
jgi:hypothetical protein